LRGGAVLLVTFLAGSFAGAAVMHLARVTPAPSEPRPVSAPPERVIENMKMARSGIPVTYEALDLTPAQRFQIARIMDANRRRTDSLLSETWPKLHALLDSIQRQVEQVLTPAQRQRLAALRRGGLPAEVQPNSPSNGGKNP
jgi:Spy/CpxP family protein refolding chaperone